MTDQPRTPAHANMLAQATADANRPRDPRERWLRPSTPPPPAHHCLHEAAHKLGDH